MIIYSSITILLLIFVLIEQTKTNIRIRQYLFIIGSFLVFFIMSFRGNNVGGDTIEYCHFYEGKYDMYGTWNNPTPELVFEPGLSWLSTFLHLFNDGDDFCFIFITSALIFLPFVYLINKYSQFKVLPLLLYMILWGLLDISYTALRQNIGLSFCLIAFIIYKQKVKKTKLKYLLTFILILFAASFHMSVYYSLLLFFCVYCIRISNIKRCSIILLISYFIGMIFVQYGEYIFYTIGSYISSIDILFRLNGYFTERYSVNNESLGLLQFLITIMICLYLNLCDKNDCNSFRMRSLVLGCILFNIFSLYPNMGRLLYPLFMVGIMASPNLNNKNIKQKMLLIVIICLTIHKIYSWYIGSINHMSGYYIYNQMFPYNFIWE